MRPSTVRRSSTPQYNPPSVRPRTFVTSKLVMRWVALAAGLLLLRLYWTLQSENPPSARLAAFSSRIAGASKLNTNRKAIIAVSVVGDDTSWLTEYFSDWDTSIYVMNDKNATLTVQLNKGRESAAYLSYIIDNYNDLPHYMVFIHALRYQWHNEDPMYDGVPVLKNLQLNYVDRVGYANLRCTWGLGCPAEMHPKAARLDPSNPSQNAAAYIRDSTEAAYAAAFAELFPNLPMPEDVGVPCGAQFALSRNAVHALPRSEYERVRRWLWETSLSDAISGRILEYSWHVLMGKPAMYCPDARDCFCEKFGLCQLECVGPWGCNKRYVLPMYANLPAGWPEVGPGENGWPAKGWYE